MATQVVLALAAAFAAAFFLVLANGASDVTGADVTPSQARVGVQVFGLGAWVTAATVGLAAAILGPVPLPARPFVGALVGGFTLHLAATGQVPTFF